MSEKEIEGLESSKSKLQEFEDKFMNHIMQQEEGKYSFTKTLIISQHPSDSI